MPDDRVEEIVRRVEESIGIADAEEGTSFVVYERWEGVVAASIAVDDLRALVSTVRDARAREARLTDELAMRQDVEFTRMNEGISALEQVIERLDDGNEWRKS